MSEETQFTKVHTVPKTFHYRTVNEEDMKLIDQKLCTYHEREKHSEKRINILISCSSSLLKYSGFKWGSVSIMWSSPGPLLLSGDFKPSLSPPSGNNGLFLQRQWTQWDWNLWPWPCCCRYQPHIIVSFVKLRVCDRCWRWLKVKWAQTDWNSGKLKKTELWWRSSEVQVDQSEKMWFFKRS